MNSPLSQEFSPKIFLLKIFQKSNLVKNGKKLFIILLIIPCIDLYAQSCPDPITNCANTPFDGNLNLVSAQFDFAVQYDNSYAKPNAAPPVIFTDVKYDAENYGGNCIDPGADVCRNDDVSSLVYDVYYPVRTTQQYANCPSPAVILFHAGGFQECSFRSQPGLETICKELAKRGYVVFNVEYRRGRIKLENSIYTSVQQQLAAYRACQDARGAIRSIIKRQNNHASFPDDDYQINTNAIFVGGQSAGGVAAMNAAWYTNPMVYDVFATPSGATIQQVLGNIDIDAYYGESTGPNKILYQSSIIGTLSMWGAVQIPAEYDLDLAKDEQDFFKNTALLKPHIGFHGKDDVVFLIMTMTTSSLFILIHPQIRFITPKIFVSALLMVFIR